MLSREPFKPKSLVSFLAHHEMQEVSASASAGNSGLSEPLQRAVVQAIRIASPLNDYRLILNLVDGVWHYCCHQSQQLDPRIIGEAVSALAATTASVGKIKSVWKVLADADHDDNYDSSSSSGDAHHNHERSTSLLTRPIGPREVNAMLTALDNRGKIRAAVTLYRQYATFTVPTPIVSPFSCKPTHSSDEDEASTASLSLLM
jgi:hypothetical protein